MSDQTFPYTAYFELFTTDGMRVSFGVGAEAEADHLARLLSYMQQLRATGFLPQMPGLEEGEKIEEVDAWVLGETSKGEPCVFLYAAAHQLQYRVATIYVEKLDELPFKSNGARKWDGDAAPTRESAEKKGYLHSVPAFKVVMEPRGTTEDGKQTWRFARVHGATPQPQPAPAPAVQPPASPPPQPKQAPVPTQPQPSAPRTADPAEFDLLPSASAALRAAGDAVRQKLAGFVASQNGSGNREATPAEIKDAWNTLTQLCGKSPNREVFSKFLTGKAHFNELTSSECAALIRIANLQTDATGALKPSPAAVEDLKAVLAAANLKAQ